MKFRSLVEEVMEERFRPAGSTGAYGVSISPDYSEGAGIDAQSGTTISFRTNGHVVKLGKLLRLAARLGSADFDFEVHVDQSHSHDSDNYSDPGPDHYVEYTIRGAR